MSSKSTQRVDKEAQRQTQQSEATGSLFCSGQLWRQRVSETYEHTHTKIRFKSEIEPDAAAPSSTVHVAYLSVHSSEKRGQTATRSTRRKKRGAPWPEQEVTKAEEKRRGKALKSTFPRFWLLSPLVSDVGEPRSTLAYSCLFFCRRLTASTSITPAGWSGWILYFRWCFKNKATFGKIGGFRRIALAIV